jgi:3-phosphoglycerate kinase
VKTLDDLITELDGDPAKGRCVFVRADLNVPLEQDPSSGAGTVA